MEKTYDPRLKGYSLRMHPFTTIVVTTPRKQDRPSTLSPTNLYRKGEWWIKWISSMKVE